MKTNYLSLYVHIPFCASKCHYCDFLSGPDYQKYKEEYIEALCREIHLRASEMKEEEKITDTVFFGGGTPSLLEPVEITRIMEELRKEFSLLPWSEISLEMNPDSVTPIKLAAYKELGINRLSMGLQSADNRELRRLGRIHTWENFLEAWWMVQKAGFFNVNIDLMSGLPGQTLKSYRDSLEKILALKPQHISAYSLILEEGTKFEMWYGEKGSKEQELPTEDVDRKMYQMTKIMLKEKGYERYEISNYSLKNYECKHNEGYWTGKPYLGLGLGSSSYLRNKRFQNENNMKQYLEQIEAGRLSEAEGKILGKQEQMEEFMFLGLRRMKGVNEEEFYHRFQVTMKEVYEEKLKKLERQKLLLYDEKQGNWKLTELGIDVSNRVFVEFM